MQRVRAMYEPMEALSFNVFDYANAHEWKAAKAAFARSVSLSVGHLDAVLAGMRG